uniref:Pre-mRNA splicing Prp18-interacting factor n=1 Tax=Tanacetum cinerariifolium TaxID=118510 RepID=A0A699IZ21_TANCI|nr:hypothetical protein [Tanacetum cinerariifolium]
MTLFNEIYDNCIYGVGMPIICTACGGIVGDGLCLPCDLREKNLYNCDPNAYSFNNSNYFPRPQDENYLCNLCGNNSHDGYDCQQQFSFVYEQEPSYNQNYDDNYYPHESLSFPCFDYCGGSHETFQCQPVTKMLIFPVLTKSKPHNHHVQNKESPENSSEETVVSKTNQEPPQDSDIHQLIEECSIEVPEQQKHKMEDTMLELVKICQEKEFLCIHDDVDDLIESALSSKLLLINLNCQRLDKKEQEVKNVVEVLFLSDNLIPPGIENVADDPEGDFCFLEELLINDSILSHESYDSNFEDNPSILRPPLEPLDVKSFFDLKPDVIDEEISDKLNEDKCFDPGREINVSTKIEDDDYFPFMFVIRFFLPYFIFLEVSPLLLSAKSEDTIFDPGISD